MRCRDTPPLPKRDLAGGVAGGMDQRGGGIMNSGDMNKFSPGGNGSPEMEQSFIYFPAGLDPGGGKMGPGFGPDWAGWAGSARGKIGVSPVGTQKSPK